MVVSFLAALSSGCAKVQARTEPVMPELMPPPPPPRVVESYEEEAPVVAEAPPTEPAGSPPAARNTTKPAAPPPAKAETPPKPEPPRAEPEKPAVQPPPPALTLKPTPGSESTTEGSIRRLISNAARDLGRVNYGSLNQDGKAQYDTAKRFMQQADDALRSGNLVFAGKLADKAATMAAVLVR